MVGIDIVKVERVLNLIDGTVSLNKILNEEELKYLSGKSEVKNQFGISAKQYCLAGLYAAKEAVLKALKLGISGGMKEVVITHGENGAPEVVISNMLKRCLAKYSKNDIQISISHDGEYAIAVCEIL